MMRLNLMAFDVSSFFLRWTRPGAGFSSMPGRSAMRSVQSAASNGRLLRTVEGMINEAVLDGARYPSHATEPRDGPRGCQRKMN